MSCEQYREAIIELAAKSGERIPTRRDAGADTGLRNHLDSCAACRARLESMRAALAQAEQALAGRLAAEPSADFAAHVRRRIASEPAHGVAWQFLWRPASAVALAGVVLAAFWWARPPGEPAAPEKSPVHVAKAQPATSVNATAETPVAGAPAAVEHRDSRRKSKRAIEVEVIVPRERAESVLQLYRVAWSGESAETILAASIARPDETQRPRSAGGEDLKIPPLKINPLADPGEMQ